MTSSEFGQHLEALALRQSDAAILLRVTPRAVRRWQVGEQEVPGPIAELVRAWRQLHAAKIPWGAAMEAIWYGDDDQIRLHQEHDKALTAVLQRVAARGGPAAPWCVNLKEHSATLGRIIVRFYKLQGGSFSPAYYRNGNKEPDAHRDQLLVEDAVAAFAVAITQAHALRPGLAWDE